MKLQDYFPPEKEVDKAQGTVDSLSKKKNLSREQKEELTVAQSLLKRRRTARASIATIFCALAVTGAGYGIWRSAEDHEQRQAAAAASAEASSDPNKEVSSKDAESPLSAEQKTNKLIGDVERGFTKFEEVLKPKVEKNVPEKNRLTFMGPFDLMRINQGNPNKNAISFHTRLEKQGRDMADTGNPNYFSFEAGNKYGMIASYSAPHRIMYLSPDFDPNNYLDLLVLFHELRHVMQDTYKRQRINSREEFMAYVALHQGKRGGKQKVFLTEEGSAILMK